MSYEVGSGINASSYLIQAGCSHFSFKCESQAGGPSGPIGVSSAGNHHAVLFVKLLLGGCKSLYSQGEKFLLRIEDDTETLALETFDPNSIAMSRGCDGRISPASSGVLGSITLHHPVS